MPESEPPPTEQDDDEEAVESEKDIIRSQSRVEVPRVFAESRSACIDRVCYRTKGGSVCLLF